MEQNPNMYGSLCGGVASGDAEREKSWKEQIGETGLIRRQKAIKSPG